MENPLYPAQTHGIQARRNHQTVQSDLVEAFNMMFLISSCTFTSTLLYFVIILALMSVRSS